LKIRPSRRRRTQQHRRHPFAPDGSHIFGRHGRAPRRVTRNRIETDPSAPETLTKLGARSIRHEGGDLRCPGVYQRLAQPLAGAARNKVGEELELIEQGIFKFCWIVDFPMYEWDEDNKKIDFSHNPFSMPQGGMEALEQADTVEKQLDHLDPAPRNSVPPECYLVRRHVRTRLRARTPSQRCPQQKHKQACPLPLMRFYRMPMFTNTFTAS
jgi:hypothetical protein